VLKRNNNENNPITFIDETFGKGLVYEYICDKCCEIVITESPFHILPIPITGVKNTVEDFINQYMNEFEFIKNCGKCGSQNIIKRKYFDEAPKILIINITYGEKPNVPIKFEEELELKESYFKTKSSHKYKLYGIVKYSSFNIYSDSGHYFSYVKADDTWIKINDDSIIQSNWNDVNETDTYPYLLFYERII
ncbi:hypothetical protein PIROE2DRAFT_14714, partial [Piromyces sp. E2]